MARMTWLSVVTTAAAVLLLAGVAERSPRLTRDISGTTRACSAKTDSQPKWDEDLASARSFAAERAGFEPAEGFDPFAALAKRCFRPLSHLSGVAPEF
jgi:hypothetical protein